MRKRLWNWEVDRGWRGVSGAHERKSALPRKGFLVEIRMLK